MSKRLALTAFISAASMAATEAGAATQYQYDALGRLIRASYDNGVLATYTYDAAGNRTVTYASPPTSGSIWGSFTWGSSNW